MKILCAEYNEAGEAAIVPVGDDALLRNNDDFYLPGFAKELSCVPQLVVRISKLGKCVGERFASRYYREMGVGIRFYADDFERILQSRGLPVGMASSFEGSAALGALADCGECAGAAYRFVLNGETVFSGDLASQGLSVEKLITLASAYHILKIGDYLFCGNRFRQRGLQVGDRLQMEFCGRIWMDFKIK